MKLFHLNLGYKLSYLTLIYLIDFLTVIINNNFRELCCKTPMRRLAMKHRADLHWLIRKQDIISESIGCDDLI